MNVQINRNAISTVIRRKNFIEQIRVNKYLFLLFIPGLLYFLIFHYGPMYGVIIAFKEFTFSGGIWRSPWIGLENFKVFFNSPDGWSIIRNTLLISVYRLLFGFPVPIIMALLLNELRSLWYKRVVQTIIYLPHFVSWVIASSIVIFMLSPEVGVINQIIKIFGGQPVYFLAEAAWFRSILVISGIWKEAGWGTIIYLAAITGIDPQIYEAATIDGANRRQHIVYITLPSIMGIVSIMFILQTGSIMNAGFEQVFNLYNPLVYSTGDIIDTYVYRVGLQNVRMSYATAVGLFKSIIGMILLFATNAVAKKLSDGEYGIW